MESTIKIIRTSIHTFLKHFHYFTFTSILPLPFSLSILLSSFILPNFQFQFQFQFQFHSLLHAAGFPLESELFSFLTLKLSQTISCSILVLPFSLSFLLIAKSIVIQSFNTRSFTGILNSILQTQLWNTLFIISANATCFWVLFIAFNSLERLHFPSLFFTLTGGIVYSIVLANALIICNLALIVSGMELSGGFISVLKACVLIRGRTAIALWLSLPVNMALAGVEFLFQFRVIKAYSDSGVNNKITLIMVLEGLFISYLYSILIIIDVIIGCVFYKSCKIAYDQKIFDQESGRIKEEDDDVTLVKC